MKKTPTEYSAGNDSRSASPSLTRPALTRSRHGTEDYDMREDASRKSTRDDYPTIPEPFNHSLKVGVNTGMKALPSSRKPNSVPLRQTRSRNQAQARIGLDIETRQKKSASMYSLFSSGKSRVDGDLQQSQHLGRSLFRSRTGTVLGKSTRHLADASIASVASFRHGFEAMGDLVVPRVKWDWQKEINEGGYMLSIVAFVVGFMVTLLTNALFLIMFSKMDPYFGAADRTFFFLDGFEKFAIPFYSASGGVFFLFYVLDFYYAPPLLKVIGFMFVAAAICCVVVATLFLTGTTGFAPMALFFFMVPVLLVVIKKLFFEKVDNMWYMLSIACALLVVFLAILITWVTWFFNTDSNWQLDEIKVEYLEYVGCDISNISLNTVDILTSNITACSEAFAVYLSPIVLSVYCFIFANVLTFTIRAETRRREKRLKRRVERFAQIFIILALLGLVAAWVFSSLFASQVASVSDQLLYLSIIALCTIGLIVFSVFGVENIRKDLASSPLGIKLVEFSDSDWASALFLFLGTPVLLFYLFISFVTQSIRRFTPLGKPLHKLQDGTDENKLVFKLESQFVFIRMGKWEWGSVLLKVQYIGLFWFIVVIGIGRIANVFLSFLNESLADLSLPVTTAVFIGAGLGMFALPPVPGLPIYLAGGIILSQGGIRAGMTFAAAGWYAVAICSLVKMLSIVLQQKFIGQILGSRSVYIRSLCNVNSIELRAMKKIMAVPGFSLPKVAVLVGGPDWPTSVLTGIMRLSLFQMVLGSIPVLITIIPVSFAGAVLIQGNEGVFASLNAILLSVSVVVQLTPFFVAVHYIAKSAIENADELEKEELDQEVLEYQKDNENEREWSIYLNEWKNLSLSVKMLHVLSCVLTVVGNMTFQFAGGETFEAFEVDDTISVELRGNVFNIIKQPLGLIMLCLVSASFLYLFIYGFVQGKRVKAKVKKGLRVKVEERRPEANLYPLALSSRYLMSQRNFAEDSVFQLGWGRQRNDSQASEGVRLGHSSKSAVHNHESTVQEQLVKEHSV